MIWWPLIYIIIYETYTFKIYTKRGSKYIHQNVPLWPVDYLKIEHNLLQCYHLLLFEEI